MADKKITVWGEPVKAVDNSDDTYSVAVGGAAAEGADVAGKPVVLAGKDADGKVRVIKTDASGNIQVELGDSIIININGDAADMDSGAGTDDHEAFAIALPAEGGHVVGGTATNPIRTDPTGTTAQPITDNGGSITVDASDLDIRNLTSTDVVTVTGGAGQVADVKVTLDSETVTLAANNGVDVGDVTINNAAGVAAVNVQDGGNSLTVDATDLDIRDLTATDVVTITGGAGQVADVKVTLDSETVVLAAGDNNVGNVDIVTLPSGNLGQQAKAASLSVAPATDITDATYIGDIKFGESLPAGDNNIGNVDIVSLPSGNLGQQAMAASVSTVPASNITDATYVGDIKFGESLPTGSNIIGKVGIDQTTPGTTNRVTVNGGAVVTSATGAGAMSTTTAIAALHTLKAVTVHLSAAPTTAENLVITLDAQAGAAYDTVLKTIPMVGVTDVVFIPDGGGLSMVSGDEIKVTYTNTDARTFGLRIVTEAR